MITIRKRISKPFLTIIIAIPITIMILFNIIVSFYTKSKAEEDLLNAVYEIEESLYNDNTLNKDSQNRPALSQNENLPNMASIINNQNHSTSAELVVFNRNGELSRIFNNDSFITDSLADLIYLETENLNYNEIGSIKFDGDTYYIVHVEYESQTLTDKLVYISKGLILDEFTSAVNIVLLIVSIITTLIALLIVNKTSKSIAKPIENLTHLVENMKSDELKVLDDNSNSLELKKLTQEINSLNKRIYQYHESQKNFLANASHELRTPLMNIQGYSDGIEMGIFQDSKATAHLISQQTKKLTQLVDSLLTLARTENFNTNQRLEKLNLSDEIINILNSYKGYAVSNNINLTENIIPNIFINANSELLSSSIGNILSNAIRYANSNVYISLSVIDKNAVITIKDDGKGIDEIDKIFDRFSKGENGNFGLGLSIAKTSVKMMNATIEAYNDNGAAFKIVIPII